jgi:hypothetical protein
MAMPAATTMEAAMMMPAVRGGKHQAAGRDVVGWREPSESPNYTVHSLHGQKI